MAIAEATLKDKRPLSALAEYFRESPQDRRWYPLEAGVPLVRIEVGLSRYKVYRRAAADAPWIELVGAPLADFDPVLFRRWAETWQLTQGA